MKSKKIKVAEENVSGTTFKNIWKMVCFLHLNFDDFSRATRIFYSTRLEKKIVIYNDDRR
jgi:hypothetical protein